MSAGRLQGAAVLVLLAAASLGARAQILTPVCSVTTAAGPDFGAYNPFDAVPRDATGNVHVRCGELLTLVVSYVIQLGPGGSGNYAARRMTSGSAQLAYNLYTNSSRSVLWGDGGGGTSTLGDSYLLSLFPTGKTYPVYGRIAAGQNVPPGTYSDSIVVTVNY